MFFLYKLEVVKYLKFILHCKCICISLENRNSERPYVNVSRSTDKLCKLAAK
jgi:hypothetical protein